MKQEITFLSTLGKGMSMDLALVKRDVFADSSVSFRYYTTSQHKKNPMKRSGILHGKKEFMKQAGDVIATDLSLSREMDELSPEGKRVLVGVPYDVCFKPKEKKADALMHYTHLICGCPYMERRWREQYDTAHLEMISGVRFPSQEEMIKQQGQETEEWIGILLSGAEELRENFMEEIKPFLAKREHVLCRTRENLLSDRDILEQATVLISNVSEYVCAFIAKKCPVYIPEVSHNHFEQYVKKYHPALWKRAKDLKAKEGFAWGEEQERFYAEFVYPDEGAKCRDTLKELFLV